MNTAQDLLNLAEQIGLTLIADGDLLRMRGKSAPPADLLAEISKYKPELLALLSASPANDTKAEPFPKPPHQPEETAVNPWLNLAIRQPLTVTDRQRTFLGRNPLVTEADLHQIQRQLMRHLIDCPDCIVDLHHYCKDTERTANGYEAFLMEFPDAIKRHEAFVSAVIRARCSGLQAGFAAIETNVLADDDTGRETKPGATGPDYGIDKRPAELAFVNHFTACAYCFPRSGKYCAEGRQLHDRAMLEGLQ